MWKPLLCLLALTAAADACAASGAPDWILANTTQSCDGTDVDFSDADHGFATCAFDLGMTTSDGGLNWTVFPTGVQQSLLWAHAADANTLYAGRLGFYRSLDAGATWAELGNLSTTSNSIFGAHLVDAQTIVALKGSDVFRTGDGGTTWTPVYVPEGNVFFHQMTFPTPETGFIAGGITSGQGSAGFVARSDDTGQTWTLLPFQHPQVTASDFFDATHGVVATFGGQLYTTADGGATWVGIGTLPDTGFVLDIVHREANHWYAGTLDGCLWETHDAGVTWLQGYCDETARPLVALDASKPGAVIGVGNDNLVLFENKIFTDRFETR